MKTLRIEIDLSTGKTTVSVVSPMQEVDPRIWMAEQLGMDPEDFP